MRKVLLIGSGGNMGQNHLRVLKKLKKKYDLNIKTCDKDITKKADYVYYEMTIHMFEPDYVIIATTTSTHEEILDYCLANKTPYIFVEKPIIDDINSLKKYTYKKNIMVGHIERFNPIVQYIKKSGLLKNIDTIICTRSGLTKKEDDFNTDIDLVIHDLDVCNFLLNKKMIGCYKNCRNNSCGIVFNVDDKIDIFLHADNKSPFKRRMIQIIGKGLFIEGDYINQTLNVNGKYVKIKKEEPLKVELEFFLNQKYSNKDLKDAINNLRLLN